MTAAACDITVCCFSPSLLGATAGLTLGGVGIPMVVSSVLSLSYEEFSAVVRKLP